MGNIASSLLLETAMDAASLERWIREERFLYKKVIEKM